MAKDYEPWDGWAHMLSRNFGQTKQPVVVVGETAMEYRIRTPEDVPDRLTRLPGDNQWLKQGDTYLVPKNAVSHRINGAPR